MGKPPNSANFHGVSGATPYTPLFPEDSRRTGKYRRDLILKTLETARWNPDLTDEALLSLIERETQPVCDLCVESGLGSSASWHSGRPGSPVSRSQRKDHVGRFFLHKLTPHLPSGPIREWVYPVLAESVVNLLGENLYDHFQRKILTLRDETHGQCATYEDLLNTPRAARIMQELVSKYWIEMQKTPAFQNQLLNHIDQSLAEYLSRNSGKEFDIVSFTQVIFRDFTQALQTLA